MALNFDLISPPNAGSLKQLKKQEIIPYKQHSPKIREFSNVISPGRWKSKDMSESEDNHLLSKIVRKSP